MSSDSQEITFGYWKIRGLAAACRMMFYYKSVPFKNVAYGEDAKEEWFGKDKPELAKKNSLINLPYLVDGETIVTQSNSCLIYLGQKLGIDLAAPQIMIHNHQALDQTMDLRNSLMKICYGPGGKDFKAALESHMEGAMTHFNKLEGFCMGPYMCGATMQSSDFNVFEMIDQHLVMCAEMGVEAKLKTCKKLMALHAAVKADAALAKYFAADCYGKYAFNNAMYTNFCGKQYDGTFGPTVRETLGGAPAAAAGKKEGKKEGKAKGPAQQAKETPEEKAAKQAAKDAEKLLKTVIKEGGKKGVEIEGASDMGGLDFFCTTIESPDGDQPLLLTAMQAMNADPDPEAEDRKGCSGQVGKMIFSAGAAQLAIVAYVPKPESNKSASKVDITPWIESVCAAVSGKVTCAKKEAPGKFFNQIEGKSFECPHGGHLAEAVVVSDPERGKFALKDKDAAMAAAFAFLREKGAFPEDDGDDSDDMVFGDDDDLDAFE